MEIASREFGGYFKRVIGSDKEGNGSRGKGRK